MTTPLPPLTDAACMHTTGCPICKIPYFAGECVRHSGEEIGDYCAPLLLQRVHQVPGGFPRPHFTRVRNGVREYFLRADEDGNQLPIGEAP